MCGASNFSPNDMPGAASRKSGIFILRPEHLIGHWAGKPKMDAVLLFFFFISERSWDRTVLQCLFYALKPVFSSSSVFFFAFILFLVL